MPARDAAGQQPSSSAAPVPDRAARAASAGVAPGLVGAALSLLYLVGSLGLAFPAFLLLSTVAPDFAERLGRPLFYGMMGVLCAGGGLLWGAHLAGRARARRRRACAVGAAVGYGLSTPLAMFAASTAETWLLDRAQEGAHDPMHLAFALIFASVLLLVVGSTTLGVALAAAGRSWRALRLAGASAGAAVVGFLAVDLAFDLAGWRVGAPGAESRSTMLVVLGAGLLVATLAAGAVVGRAAAAIEAHPAPPAA